MEYKRDGEATLIYCCCFHVQKSLASWLCAKARACNPFCMFVFISLLFTYTCICFVSFISVFLAHILLFFLFSLQTISSIVVHLDYKLDKTHCLFRTVGHLFSSRVCRTQHQITKQQQQQHSFLFQRD